MSEKIDIDVDKISSMELRDQGTFFVEHFDKYFDDPKYIESVKRWAKKILTEDAYSTSEIRIWDTSWPQDLLGNIIEIKSDIPLVTSEEDEMLKTL